LVQSFPQTLGAFRKVCCFLRGFIVTGDSIGLLAARHNYLRIKSKAAMVFIGGGAGMAPMRSRIFDQLKRIRTKRKLSFWYGAHSLREVFYVDVFNELQAANPNLAWTLALSDPLPEDNWTGGGRVCP
jgi:Na+-transporting NADH:ubiquinone oxidoreductase subunit F